MSISSKILSEAMLSEFRGGRKQIGRGEEKIAYESPSNQDIVIVQAHSRHNIESLHRIIAAYKNRPDLIAKPIRLLGDRLVIEKLDTEAFMNEAEVITEMIYLFYQDWNKSEEFKNAVEYFDGETLYLILKSIEYGVDDEIDEFVTGAGMNEDLWRKWHKFVIEIDKSGFTNDLHDGQAGLDKQGNLKLFDY